jgi:hypothetical protein
VVKKLAMATARMPFEVKQRINDTDSVNEDGPLAGAPGAPEPAHVGVQAVGVDVVDAGRVRGSVLVEAPRPVGAGAGAASDAPDERHRPPARRTGRIGYVYSNGS